jgi:flagellar basal body P-ring protein FlgI
MNEDIELTQTVISYMSNMPHLTAYDIVKHFESLGVSPEKVLYILKELDN